MRFPIMRQVMGTKMLNSLCSLFLILGGIGNGTQREQANMKELSESDLQ
jgi:hypothetical protein